MRPTGDYLYYIRGTESLTLSSGPKALRQEMWSREARSPDQNPGQQTHSLLSVLFLDDPVPIGDCLASLGVPRQEPQQASGTKSL